MILHLRDREREGGGRERLVAMPALLNPLTITVSIFSLTPWDPGPEPLLLFGSIYQNNFFLQTSPPHTPPPEESAQTWQRFYLFNELKALHDETEAFQTPTFLFTNPRLTKINE